MLSSSSDCSVVISAVANVADVAVINAAVVAVVARVDDQSKGLIV